MSSLNNAYDEGDHLEPVSDLSDIGGGFVVGDTDNKRRRTTGRKTPKDKQPGASHIPKHQLMMKVMKR